MNLGLIGNCAYQALIDRDANVSWLCWPRFDSSFVFGSLLDSENGGRFSIEAENVRSSSQSYLTNTNILVTRFECDGGALEVTDFAPRFRQMERSFKPNMLVRWIRPVEGRARVRVRCEPVWDYGRLTPEGYAASNHLEWRLPNARLRLTTNVPLAFVEDQRAFTIHDDVFLVLTWGEPLEAPLRETCRSFFDRTRAYWERWVKHTQIPEVYQREVIRSALTLKMHQFEDTGAITAATTTSIPEYPGSGRCWDYRYCWLRDAYFTLGALRRMGHFEEMDGFIAYLHDVAWSRDASLQPVYGIAGRTNLDETTLDHLSGFLGEGPVRIGNAAYAQAQHDVYGEMLASISPLFTDVRFERGREGSTDLARRLLTQISAHMTTPDAGLWEKRHTPRLHTFSLLMHWLGARAGERIARAIGDEDLESEANTLREQARTLIDEKCWREDRGFFADATDTDDADAALLLMVTLGYLRPDDPRAESHVRALYENLDAGHYLLHRYRHDDGIGETHGAFTVCSFWYVEALARLGQHEEAREAFESLLQRANHLGLYSEDLHPQTLEQWGNFPQTYSHVGLINAAFALAPQL